MTEAEIAHQLESLRAAHRDKLGCQVSIGLNGGEILATVEEVIWARNMVHPYYLVEYWHDGHLISRRVHAEDCR